MSKPRSRFPSRSNLFNAPQVCGRARAGVKEGLSELEALRELEKEVINFVQHVRWANYGSVINELRRPLLTIKLARRSS
jgi:hypothetical protein